MQEFVYYKEKYIKYKSKYFQLKQDLEGGIPPTLAFRAAQSLIRVGKQTYKSIKGTYDTEIREINAILNKTVYIDQGNILTVYDYDPKEDFYKQGNVENEGIQIIYSNLELLDPKSVLSKKNKQVDSTVSEKSNESKLPNVKKFLTAVRKIIDITTDLADKEDDIVIQNVYKNRICDLNRILEIHYMCKGSTGVFNYTVAKCFTDNHIPPSQTMTTREKSRLSADNNQQYSQSSYQYGQQYRTHNDLYKLKYFKYKAKYLELEGGFLAAMGKAASAAKAGLVSVATGAKNIVVSAGSSVDVVVNIMAKYPDIKTEFTNQITDKDFKEKLKANKTTAETEIKNLTQKISDIKRLESIISNKCKLKSADTTYTNTNCFNEPKTPVTATNAQNSTGINRIE